jgi:replicative DNA helicase
MAITTPDREAEIHVLGSCILSQDALLAATDSLRPEMFGTELHRAIFRAIIACDKPDLITVCDEYRRQNPKDTNTAYIASLSASVASPQVTPRHVEIIRRAHYRRELTAAGRQIIDLAKNETDVPLMLGQAESLVYGITETGMGGRMVSMDELIGEQWVDYEQNRAHGVPTGYEDLDDALTGLQPAELIIVAARPSMGKSDFALNIARNTAKVGSKVAFFSLEMSRLSLATRMICAEGRVNSQHYRAKSLNETEKDAALAASAAIASLPIFIDDSPRLTVAEMRSKTRRLHKDRGIDLVIVDYLQLVRMERMRGRTRNEEVGEATKELKAIGKEFGIPVMVLCQLSREVEKRADKIPQLSDLRDSGEIEQDADVVLFPHRPEYYKSSERPGVADIYIAKQRNGPTGKVTLRYIKHNNRFEPLGAADRAREVFGGVISRDTGNGTGEREKQHQFA